MAKVKKITVSNLKAVSALSADFNGCTAIITGGNNKGKSSFLRSLPDRLRGIKPDVVLKHGEKEGSAEWELTTGEKLVWAFDGKKEKLTYVSERNIAGALTKEISSRYFPNVFDVDKFLSDTPAKQKATLQKLTGIDFTEIDTEFKEAYENRTYRNKQLADAKARLVFFDPKMPKNKISTEDLESELNGIEAHNLRFKGVEEKAADKRSQLERTIIEIAELKMKLATLQGEQETLEADLDKGAEWMKDPKNMPKTNAAELQAKIQGIRTQNEAIEENIKSGELQKAYELAAKEAADADADVKRIESEKLEVIKNASMPDGLGFSEDGITYNGFEYNREQLASSTVVIVALKLAAIGLGEVKTLYFDASFCDKNSLMEVEKWANENDLQLLIERPDFDGGEIEYQIIQTS